MCNSIADGGLRCAGHLEAAIKTHEENHNWEVIKAANDAGITFGDVSLSPEEEAQAEKTAFVGMVNNDELNASAKALADLNAEKSKYAFALATRDESVVARYLYENSESVIQGNKDLARAKRLYETRLLEIDYNEKAQKESGVERQEAKEIQAEKDLAKARERYEDIEAGITMASAGETDEALYDVHDAEDKLKKAKEYDRVNFHAVFDAEKEREKAKSDYRYAQRKVLNASSTERSKAMQMAPMAINAYRDGDASSLKLPQGPNRGKFPDSIQKKETIAAEAQAHQRQEQDKLKKRATREALREKISKTDEFKVFAQKEFSKTPRGKEYHEKRERLRREFKLTEKYEKQVEAKLEAAKSAGLPYGEFEQEIQDVQQKRALTITARKNAYAKELISAGN